MRKIRKELFVVVMACLLGMSMVVYFNSCAAAEALLDGGLKDVGRPGDDGGTVCTPACDAPKNCGDDGCGGSCGSCQSTEQCSAAGVCEPKTVCTPDCTGKACGDDDGCNTGKCTGTCATAGEVCDSTDYTCKPCTPTCDPAAVCGDMDSCNSAKCTGTCAIQGQTCNATTFVCEGVVQNDCTGKNCGEVGTDGTTKCNGPCADANFICDGDPNWYCKDNTCTIDCANKACGDQDGCGGQCIGTCATAGNICDAATYTCIPDPCTGATCGQVVNNYICLGTCANAAEECRIAADGQSASCVACNASGADVGQPCADQAACKCGNNCALLFSDQTGGGECLMDCTADAAVCTGTQICGCSGSDGNGNCIAGACYETGTLKGTFAGGLTATCSDQPAQTDIGSGNLTVAVPGKTANVNMFYGCIDSTGTEPMSILFGLKTCGSGICPDVIAMGATHAVLKVGVLNFKDGGLFAQWSQYTFSGQTTTEIWMRGISYEGTMTLSQAGKTAKAKFAGSMDTKVMKYDLESCGPNTQPCQ